MATYDVTAQTRRVQFTGNGTAGPFAFSFQVNATSEIKVYVDTTVKTESSHYTVSLSSSTGAGTVSFTSGNHPTSSQIITILGSIPLARTSVYTSGGQLTSASLESDFDTNMFVHQQTGEEIDRSLRQAEHDTISGADMTLPVKADRLGKVLGFNSSSGNPEAVNQITTASVTASTVSVGGDATATVSQSGNTATFAFGIPTGATGATGATGQAGGGLANVISDTTPQLGGDLDMNGKDIVTTSNADIELAPNGTGKTVLKGNTNPGTIVFNCESNSHGQTVKSQPHSASVTNVLTLPPGSDQEIVGASATQTLTNKTIGVAQLSGQVAIAKGGTGATTLAGANIVTTNAQNTFTKAQLSSTFTGTNLTLDFDTYQNFILTLSSGSNSLANPSTEGSQIGQTGVIIFIQPSSSSAGTVSLGTDYESVGAGGLTLSSANNDYDVVPYIVKADNSILLGTAQLNFG